MAGEQGEKHGPVVAIVGGGLAGMATAVGLVEAGFIQAGGRVLLIEAKRRTGGRAGSFLDADSGHEVDYCQHVAMGCCTNFLHLIGWAGLENEFTRYQRLDFFNTEGVSSKFAPSGWLPAPLHLAPAFSGLAVLTKRERREVSRGLFRLMRMNLQQIERHAKESRKRMTMGQWLRRHGQSEGGIRKFWNLVLASALGEHVDAVAIGPARKVFVDGFMACHGASDVLVPQQSLSELFGRRLPEKLSKAGVELISQRRIRQLVAMDENRIELRTDNLPAIKADYVVSAVPWFALPRLLKDSGLQGAVQRLDDIGLFPGSPISGIHLWLDRPLTDLPHAVIADAVSQWLFRDPKPLSSASDESGEHYYQVVISAAQDVRGRDPDELQRQIVSELNSVFRCAQPVRALRWRVVTDPLAVFSITPEVELTRPACRTEAKNLFLAGDWVQTGWPATMESAVISGFQAAEAVLERCGTSVAVVQPPLKRSHLSRAIIR